MLICQHIPQVADALFGVPLSVESPKGCDGMKFRAAGSGIQIVGEPTAVAAITLTTIIIGTLSPRAWIEHLVGIGITDVGVEDIGRQLAVDEVELGVVVVASKGSGTLGVESGIGDDKFLASVSPTVVPDDGTAVTVESAAGGIAPASWTKEIDTWAA